MTSRIDGVRALTRTLIDDLTKQARQSSRLRTNYNFHHSMEENPHRFLNVMVEGTYIQPHRHVSPPKAESFLEVQGQLAFFTFDDAGRVLSVTRLGTDPFGIDIEPGVWHSMRFCMGPQHALR